MLSRAYGHGDWESQKRILRYAVITVLAISCIVYAAFLLAANPMVSVFNSEQKIELQQIAVTGLKLYFTAIPFAGFNIILSAYFAAIEKPLPAQLISLSRGFAVILPMAFLMSALLEMTGVWLSFPLTECLVAFAAFALYIATIHTHDSQHT